MRVNDVGLKVALLITLIVVPTSVDAQTCSPADRQALEQDQRASLEALLAGDVQRFTSIQNSRLGSVSPGCRIALAEREPVRVRCTVSERAQMADQLYAALRSARVEGIRGYIGTWLNIETSVSRACWAAANRYTDSEMLSACTTSQLDHISSFATRLLRAEMSSWRWLSDVPLLQEVMGPMAGSDCEGALYLRLGGDPTPGTPSTSEQRFPNIIDHGDGMLTMPGAVTCTSSDCYAH